MTKSQKLCNSEQSRPKSPPPKDMLEQLNCSPWYSLGKIIPTSNKPKINVFDSYRTTKQCVDYKISETWTKMQHGDLKVNLRQTSATYTEIPREICKPKKLKKIKLFSGGPPQWRFIDELWRENVDNQQKILVREHFEEKTVKDRLVKKKKQNKHCVIQELVGPEWFMELSPSQLEAVDLLPMAVIVDIRNRQIDSCRDCLAILGLVLRPSRHHVKKALRHSCGNAVEFLLVLYQLMNPTRTQYSLNDRLLLSAVVHLSIVPTLKELHIRIPSPPKVPAPLPKPPIKSPRKTYKSPYLAPQTYEPEPPKFTGVYTNKHRQYAESPYFSYMKDLEKLQKEKHVHVMVGKDEETRRRMREYNDAQTFYESIEGVKKELLQLIWPKELRLCPNLLNPPVKPEKDPRFKLPSLCKVAPSEEVVCYCTDQKPQEVTDNSCEGAAYSFLDELCMCDDCIEQVRQDNLIRIHGGIQTSCCCDESITIIQGTVASRSCSCLMEFRDRVVGSANRHKLVFNPATRVIGDVIPTKFGPVYQIQATVGWKICLCHEIEERKAKVNLAKRALLTSGAIFVNGGITMTPTGPVYALSAVKGRTICKCVQSYWEQLKVLFAQNQLRTNWACFVNQGLVITKDGPMFCIGGVPSLRKDIFSVEESCSCEIIKPECFAACLDWVEYRIDNHDHESTSLVEEPRADSSSDSETESDDESCTEEEETLHTCVKSLCTCCTHTSTSTEVDLVHNEHPHQDPCSCKEELDRFMKSKCPCDVCMERVHQKTATYIMGGTKETESGKVNLIQGVQQMQCACLKQHHELTSEIDKYKSRAQARFQLKSQPQKYQISGVKETGDGPVYMISGMRPAVECECGKFKQEQEQSDQYERQRAKPPEAGRIKYEISGVKAMTDENVYILARALKVAPCDCERFLKTFEKAHQGCLGELQKFLELKEATEDAYQADLLGDKGRFMQSFVTRDVIMDLQQKDDIVEAAADDTDTDTDEPVEEEEPLPPEDEPQISTHESESSSSSTSTSSIQGSCNCLLGIPQPAKPITLPEKMAIEESFISKRFAIYRTLPKCMSDFMEVVKHILEGMADDGFPLAKLPQVHKLPIIKLWIHRRLGHSWTLQDKFTYHKFSKEMWKHTDTCVRLAHPKSMPFTVEQSKKMTWRHANLIRKLAEDRKQDYYRKVKQRIVDAGREFFATTFPYEFPTKTWRECAFSYLPTKEEDLFPFKIYQPHDARVVPDNKRFNCYC